MLRHVALAAGLIMIGNVVSRLLGLIRELVMAWLFGATGATDAFVAASAVPMIAYDLLIGGSISAALVPVLVDQTRNEQRFGEVVSSLLTLAAVMLLGVTAVLMIFSPAIMAVLGGGFDAQQREQSVAMVRVMLVAVIFQGLAGVLMAALYARQRFAAPSFAPALYNGAIILAALVLHPVLGVESMVAGVVIGAVLQMALQLASLRGMRFRLGLGLGRPEVRTALRLYAPVAAGMGVTIIGIVIDRYLASLLEDGSMTIMSYATRLIQFPLGLVGVAISSAILPTLSAFASSQSQSGEAGQNDFREALVSGIRLVFFLMTPALVGIVVLREPLVELVFQRGQFSADDTLRTALVLMAYAPQLPLTAMDQLLIVAFYSRKDTRTPVIVGVITVLLYLVSALALIQPLGVVGLAAANAIQNGAHGLILLALMHRVVGSIVTTQGISFVGRIAVAAATMAAVQMAGLGFTGIGSESPLVSVMLLGGLGLGVYVGVTAALRVSEPGLLLAIIRRPGNDNAPLVKG
jgi:putative peptidoglycan lipid II flippase